MSKISACDPRRRSNQLSRRSPNNALIWRAYACRLKRVHFEPDRFFRGGILKSHNRSA
jgi:hypothetical protein